MPDQLRVWHNSHPTLPGAMQWIKLPLDLYDENDEPVWLEHPQYGRRVDVVAIPLKTSLNVTTYPYDPSNPGADLPFGPADPVSVIGFPFGQTAGAGQLGVWVQGTIATEAGVDFDGLPLFLIDSRTRPGQSGSPVILYRRGSYGDAQGALVVSGGEAERFVGVYSGRINDESDLGFVWKAAALAEILHAGKRGPYPVIAPSTPE